MKHFSLAAFSFALFLAACGDDSSSVSADNPSSEVDSSSSIVSDDSKESSDSKSNDKVSSSSSVKKVESSSSEKKTDSEKSSSSEKSSGDETKSSSSEETTSSSSEAESSSSLAGSVYDADKKTLTDNRDGQVYKTVTIGDQIWMAENLNYADSSETPSLKGKSWCFDNDTAKCTTGGRLYTWAAAIDLVTARLAVWKERCRGFAPRVGICLIRPNGTSSSRQWVANLRQGKCSSPRLVGKRVMARMTIPSLHCQSVGVILPCSIKRVKMLSSGVLPRKPMTRSITVTLWN